MQILFITPNLFKIGTDFEDLEFEIKLEEDYHEQELEEAIKPAPSTPPYVYCYVHDLVEEAWTPQEDIFG